MLEIDGSAGEGGGQILRSSLGLSLVTGRPVRLTKIRAGRKRPGLRPQHLAAVRAAAEVGRADVRGAELDSRELIFRPSAVRPGDYTFEVQTAGSMTLVVQTVLPALLRAEQPSRLRLTGGTHNPMAPPYDFLDRVYFPLVERMGPRVERSLSKAGFYPKGGGRFEVGITPARKLEPLFLTERGEVTARRARCLVARLPEHVAERELAAVAAALGWHEHELHVEQPRSRGPGNALLLEVECEHSRELFTAFGEKGRPAAAVADDAVGQLRRWLDADVPVGEYQADQLLVLLALAGGGAFRTHALSLHAQTQVDLLPRFLPIAIEVDALGPDQFEVRVSRRSG